MLPDLGWVDVDLGRLRAGALACIVPDLGWADLDLDRLRAGALPSTGWADAAVLDELAITVPA